MHMKGDAPHKHIALYAKAFKYFKKSFLLF